MPIDLIRLLAFAPCGMAVLIGAIRRMAWPFTGFLAMLAMIPAQEATVLASGRTLVWLLGIGVLGIWGLQTLAKGKLPRIAAGPLIVIGIWLCWCAVSVFWAQDQAAGLTRLMVLGQLLAFYLLIQLLVTTDSHLETAVRFYFAAAVFVAALTIVVSVSTGLRRAFLVEGQNPNALARALGVGLLMTPYVLEPLRRWKWRILVLLGATVLAIAIVLTGSRGAWVGLVAAGGATWLLVRSRLMKARTLVLIGVVLVLGIVGLYQGGVIDDYMIWRIVTLPDVQATSGWSGRTTIWSVGWEVVRHQPFAGVGLGNFPVRFDEYVDEAGQTGMVASSRDPHNVFLSIQAETGIVGLVLFLTMVLAVFKPLVRVRGDPRAILGMLLLTFVFFTGVSGTIIYMKFYWLAIGLAAAIPGVIALDKT